MNTYLNKLNVSLPNPNCINYAYPIMNIEFFYVSLPNPNCINYACPIMNIEFFYVSHRLIQISVDVTIKEDTQFAGI